MLLFTLDKKNHYYYPANSFEMKIAKDLSEELAKHRNEEYYDSPKNTVEIYNEELGRTVVGHFRKNVGMQTDGLFVYTKDNIPLINMVFFNGKPKNNFKIKYDHESQNTIEDYMNDINDMNRLIIRPKSPARAKSPARFQIIDRWASIPSPRFSKSRKSRKSKKSRKSSKKSRKSRKSPKKSRKSSKKSRKSRKSPKKSRKSRKVRKL